MNTTPKFIGFGALIMGAIATASGETSTQPAGIDGQWDAALLNNGPDIPFRLDITGSGPTLSENPVVSTADNTLSSYNRDLQAAAHSATAN